MIGTRNVPAACEEAGVKRFVHCGTEAALAVRSAAASQLSAGEQGLAELAA